MGHIIAFAGLKDGVGKTSLASHIAYLLALCEYKVLLIDMDCIHHELTKRLLGNNAFLKNIECNEIFYPTLNNILSVDCLPDIFPFEQLPLPLWCQCAENMDRGKGCLCIIPSYYREPQSFWMQGSDFSFWPGLMHFFSFYRDSWDFIIVDTIALQNKNSFPILKGTDSVILVSYPYPYFSSNLTEYMEYLAEEKKVLFCENMVLDKKGKGLVSFSQDFFCFEARRNSHKKKFFWDTFSQEHDFSPSSRQWTISMFLLLQEILDQFQEKLSRNKMPSFMKNFAASHPYINAL